ncbi:Hypothetical_protein [Hexamita inflata]|uniref:Hypothetical_protein n=1 Tax=Hexamita inflata TaxID=28002 RepID=A0AA86NLQ5_9EUKA|nr:Hypothetical protein HINF_LOCUS9895 [Hexamita inflata]
MAAKDEEIRKYKGLYGSSCKQVNYLNAEIGKLQEEVTILEPNENQYLKDYGKLLEAIDDKIYKVKVLGLQKPHYTLEAKMLWTIRRIISPSVFRMDQIQLGAPAERTIQRWKYGFKKEMKFIENVMNENYIDSGPLADLHRQSKKIPEDEIQYGSILYDAICFITKTIQLDDGTTKNVLEVIDRNGNVKNMPIKYAFAYIWSNHKRDLKQCSLNGTTTVTLARNSMQSRNRLYQTQQRKNLLWMSQVLIVIREITVQLNNLFSKLIVNYRLVP